jgi:dinuclear metal center YbgI/SA1388 family protein
MRRRYDAAILGPYVRRRPTATYERSTMPPLTINDVCSWLGEIAPLELAEEWDNVGLLVGDRTRGLERLMTCLTIAPTTAAEAIERRADLIVVHHPLPFHPVSQLTTDSAVGGLLWELLGAGVAIYSAHTAFDSASAGINQQLAKRLGLSCISPLVPRAASTSHAELGGGRYGILDRPVSLVELARCAASALATPQVAVVGEDESPVSRVAVACGSGGSFLAAARDSNCDCLVVGETNFHTCLEAEAGHIGLILVGHYASERFAMEELARMLAVQFADLDVWASGRERDPIRVVPRQ